MTLPSRQGGGSGRSPTPAPARQRLSPQHRQNQLMDATVQVLAAHGFHKTSADAIVARAGVSKGLLWRYFADLDDLMEQTARRTLTLLARAVGEGMDLTAPAPEVIRTAIHGAAALLRTHPAERAALQQIVPNLRSADGSQRARLDDYSELWTAQEAIFRRGQNEGDFRDTLDPHLLAVTYQGAVDAMLNYLEEHPETDPDQHAETLADILLDGIRDSRRGPGPGV